ncbi:hypothetical protein [Klenkia sp. PcliD-1-E]|uniref:hypothetical protein n=1 Tax=Klenkia sp. PcliD-1-E TaxID=2954492 RepID=UPI00209735E3|nr:hypothetical protein [Klenkia sp. PcliD-1-E]MCO7219494.1 hypothetical protein [Klenkia sp. PcliD-1-E]
MPVTIRANLGLRVFMGLIIAFQLLINTAILPAFSTAPSAFLYGSMFGALAIPAWLVATSKISADRDSVQLINMWSTKRIPMDTVRWIAVDNGFEVVLNSGKREGSTAVAQSLIGAIGKYPSARRARTRIEESLGRQFDDPSQWCPDTSTVETRPRVAAIGWGAAYALGAGLLTLLIFLATHS